MNRQQMARSLRAYRRLLLASLVRGRIDGKLPVMAQEKDTALRLVTAARAEAPGQTGEPVDGSRYGLVYNWPQPCGECLDRLRVMFACTGCGEITCVDCECRCYRDGDL